MATRITPESNSKLKQHHKPTNEDLTHFCLAVKQKNNWERKVMDDKVALKWAVEAELVPLDSDVLTGEAFEAISELRRSILTIRQLDQNISLNPNLDVSSKLEDITSIDSDFKNALKYARGSKYGLCEPETKEWGLGVYVSDNLVPASVHQELVRELDALAAKQPRDYHPGSFGKVQNLIHPSLYPYVAGLTPTSSPDIKLPPTVGDDGTFQTELFNNLDTQIFSSAYAWIPSVFKVSPDGTDVHIDSYINGLGDREEFPGLFRVLEKMFLLSLPHFEKTMEQSAKYSPKESQSVIRWKTRMEFVNKHEGSITKEMWEKFLASHANEWDAQKLLERQAREDLHGQEKATKESFYDLGDEFVASKTYKGKELKVIVKAANYTLAPGREHEGSWHMEGMPHERIVASVIYYYDTDSAIEDKGLSFRKFRDPEHDFPAVDEDQTYRHEDFRFSFHKDDEEEAEESIYAEEDYVDNYPSDWEIELDEEGNRHPVNTSSFPAFIELGTVPTTNFNSGISNGTGRMLSFPNWLQNRSKTPPIAAKVLQQEKFSVSSLSTTPSQTIASVTMDSLSTGFWGMNVLTTSQIPMQIRKCNEPTFLALLPLISAQLTKGTPLPPELVAIIWEYVSAGTMTREEAEGHRLKLMNDRKVDPRHSGDWDGTYSLCEH
ncbi:hypothetical protein BT96DRAFT_1025294 [Gymnopus androsaceus JB14]|uniref:DUF4246 domain-containing protein n=1 Tax=Gymnopus androsaceus JB14 TaxID=1447944 RepID=A0A6A4GSK8_9AGAR|nr:hypothetical protein BT96DRAFT_1025294 [Gymnopus androsaceus JB14]